MADWLADWMADWLASGIERKFLEAPARSVLLPRDCLLNHTGLSGSRLQEGSRLQPLGREHLWHPSTFPGADLWDGRPACQPIQAGEEEPLDFPALLPGTDAQSILEEHMIQCARPKSALPEVQSVGGIRKQAGEHLRL